jgi:hypothetical protein
MKVFVVTKTMFEAWHLLGSNTVAIFSDREKAEKFCELESGTLPGDDGSYLSERTVDDSWSNESLISDYFDIKEMEIDANR